MRQRHISPTVVRTQWHRSFCTVLGHRPTHHHDLPCALVNAFAEVVEPHVEVSRLTKENAELREAFNHFPPLVDAIGKLHPRS